jgi:hypothetical protein
MKVMWEGTDHWDLLLEELPYQDNWYCLTSVKRTVPIQKRNKSKGFLGAIPYPLYLCHQSKVLPIRAKSLADGETRFELFLMSIY